MAIRSIVEPHPLLARKSSASEQENAPRNWRRTTDVARQNNSHRFQMRMSGRFLALCFLITSIFSFFIGHFFRFTVISGTQLFDSRSHDEKALLDNNDTGETFLSGKKVPSTIYTSRHFDTPLTRKSDSFLARPDMACHENETPLFHVNECPTTFAQELAAVQEKEEEVDRPQGQHIFVDIKNVDGHFLDSEARLAQAMLSLLEKTELSSMLLSYHCHALEPIGVTCVAILVGSHITLHTWPIPGVITLDLFTTTSTNGDGSHKPLLPLLPDIEKLFAIPQQQSHDDENNGGSVVMVEPPHVQWAHKQRGFRNSSKGTSHHTNPEDVDMDEFLLGWKNYRLKTHVATINTDFQTLDVFDVINPRFNSLESYQKSLSKDGSYESQHPEFFRPERIVYLDKIMQSRLFGEAAYHEALVHPAMFAHDDPVRVAIIGGGEGATLREVLKHKYVQKVTMVEIDEDMVNASKMYLPEWSDCGNLVGSAPSCFDDPRAEIFYMDAIAWFIERFGRGGEDRDEADRYDVIIMDALDPSSIIEFSDKLYDNQDFARAIFNALTESGVFVAQIGEGEYMVDPPRMYSDTQLDDIFIDHMKNEGFEKIKDYTDELHGGFMGAWSFLIAFKDSGSNEAWYANEAAVNLEIRYRILPTVTGESPLRYFDGATMQSYSYPSRIVEEVFCRNDPKPTYCERGNGLDPERPSAPITAFEVKASDIPGAGRGVFFKESFPKGTYIAPDEGGASMLVGPATHRVIKKMLNPKTTDSWEALDYYIFGYGFANDFFGDPASVVDGGILTFVNHGCNGTYNMGFHSSVTELTADPHAMPDEIENCGIEAAVYNPFIDRNYIQYFSIGTTLRDVATGEELRDNYLVFFSSDEWEDGVHRLRAECLGQRRGAVSDYEQGLDVSYTVFLHNV